MRARFLGLPMAMSAVLLCGAGGDEAPANWANDPKNLNPDPNYVPGPYAMPDQFAARTDYEARRAELVKLDEVGDAKKLFTLSTGEIAFGAVKNETARVQGYFRNWFGVAKLGAKGIDSMDVLIDVNSLDTAVPGRNYRILNILFDATKPELGTALVRFDKFDLKGKPLAKAKSITASGTIDLNGTKKPITAELKVEKKGSTYLVETEKPIALLLSDFALGARVPALLKECNHKSIGNTVEVSVKLALR
jgi:hypothetical protein